MTAPLQVSCFCLDCGITSVEPSFSQRLFQLNVFARMDKSHECQVQVFAHKEPSGTPDGCRATRSFGYTAGK